VSELLAIRGPWDDLLERSQCNRAFSSCTWQMASMESHETRPHTVVAISDGRLRALLPLRINTEGALVAGSPLADYNDIVAASGDSEACGALLRFLAESGVEVSLKRVRSDSNCMSATGALDLPARTAFSPQGVYSFIDLRSGYAAYLASRSGKFRRGLARARRNADRDGLCVRDLSPSDLDPDSLPDLFLSLHLDRLGERSVFAPGSENDRFVRLAFPRLFREGRMRVFAIYRGAECLAIDVAMAGWQTICLWNGGYRACAAPWSPGTLLLDLELRTLEAQGYSELDLSRGDQAWKKRWASSTRPVGLFEMAAAEKLRHVATN
jgi:CelD/BcsL family acetyltransferase involved in cellulose biosynthesis